MRYSYKIRFLSQGRPERKQYILGVARVVFTAYPQLFVSFPSPEKTGFWRFFANETFIYCTMDTIYGMHVEGTHIHLSIEKHLLSANSVFFPEYLLPQRFFLYVLVIFSLFYDVDMDKISR